MAARSEKSGQRMTSFGNGHMTMRRARNRAASRRKRKAKTCHGARTWLKAWPSQPSGSKIK